MERRGSVPFEGTNEGEAECLRVVEAAGTTLTRPYNEALRTGAVLEEFERQRASIDDDGGYPPRQRSTFRRRNLLCSNRLLQLG